MVDLVRKCKICNFYKVDDLFYKNRKVCKSCFSIIQKKNRENNKEKLSIIKKKYYEDNKKEILLKTKEYRENNKEYYKEYHKNYYNENIEILKNYKKDWYKNNKEVILDKRSIYYLNNKDIILPKLIEYGKNNRESINKRNRFINKNRRITDPLFKIKNNIRATISISIKYKGFSKNKNTNVIIGLEYEDFIKYLESKFESWMTWDNYGKYNGELNYGWDIDHIIPMSSAKTEDEIYKLNHYTNLQPLCSKTNRDIKKDKLEYAN